jgi:hypothetical protein
MRTHANTSRSVAFPNIGEKKQHEQGSSPRNHVDAPIQKITGIAGIGWEAAVNVPACVSRIVSGRKTNWERPEIRSRAPSAWTDKLIKRLVQDLSIRGGGKRLLSIHAQSDHWPRPGPWVGLITTGVPPQNGTAPVSKLTRKGLLNFHEAFLGELADL